MNRCGWCNLKNPLYVAYHDYEWGKAVRDDRKLFEFLVLESFQAGLSWETVLNKREHFREVFDHFDPELVCLYDDAKIEQLMADPGIIRNRRKIEAAIRNASVFQTIQEEWGSFSNYIWHFTGNRTLCESGLSSSPLSDLISKDLIKRGMRFVGTTIIYAYLQAIGIIWSHDAQCAFFAKIDHSEVSL